MAPNLPTLIQAVDAAGSANTLLDAVEDLADAQLTGAIPKLVEVLGYNNPGAAVAAVEGLIQLGEPAVAPLLEQLDQHNYTARAWAIRALSGIGDPRGLITLLGAATADFSMSVRRAAARGLGNMQWQWFPLTLLEIAQEEALEALLFVAQQDEEWIVRYSAVVGLQSLARAIAPHHPLWRTQIDTLFDHLIANDDSQTVRARVHMAKQHLQIARWTQPQTPDTHAPHITETDWQRILGQLYQRKAEERETLPEGDPRRFRDIAVAIAKPNTPE